LNKKLKTTCYFI